MNRAACLSLFILVAASPASAQSVLQSPEAIRSCLCSEQSVAELRIEVQKRSTFLDSRRAELASLDETERAKTAKLIAAVLAPLYADSVRDYDTAKRDYAGRCARHSYDPAVLARVRPTLICIAGRSRGIGFAGLSAPRAAPPRFAGARGCCDAPPPEVTRRPGAAPLY